MIHNMIVKRKSMLPIVVVLINLYLFLYVLEVYGIKFPFSESDIRTYIIIFLGIILLVDLFFYHFVDSFQIIVFLYMLAIVFSLYINSLLTFSKIASDLFFPFILLLCTRVFSKASIYDIQFILKMQIICLILYFSLFLFGIRSMGLTNGMFINSCYYCSLLLPFTLCIKNNYIKYGCMIITLIPSIIVGKRGAFLSVLFSTIIYLLTKSKKQNFISAKWFKIFISFFILFLIIIFYYIGKKYDIFIFDRLMSITSDGGSGRLELAKDMVGLLKQNGMKEWLFGHGSFTSSSFLGNSSHNDILEMLWSYGLFGFIPYLIMIFNFFRIAANLKNNNSFFYGPCMAALVSFLVCSLFSQLVFVPTYVAFILMFFSLCKSNSAKYY